MKKIEVKMSLKQICNVIMILSVAAFAYMYLSVYTGYQEKTKECNEKKAQVDSQIEQRRELLKQSETLEDEIDSIQDDIDQILERYPSHLSLPDVLMFLQKFEDEKIIEVDSISIPDVNTFYNTTIPVRNSEEDSMIGHSTSEEEKKNDDSEVLEGADTAAQLTKNINEQLEAEADNRDISADTEIGEDASDVQQLHNGFMNGLKCTVTVTYQAKYEKIKECMKYIQDYSDRLTLDNISMTYDKKGKKVSGTFQLSIYAIEGDGKPYTPPDLSWIKIGRKIIFDTGSKQGK